MSAVGGTGRGASRRCAAVLAGLALIATAGCGSGARPGTSVLHASPSGHSSVVVIVMENEEERSILGNGSAPFENRLARTYGVATASFAIRHPSLPNYLALTSGSTHGISSDCTDCTVNAPNLAGQLSTAGLSWKGYFEGMPSPCFKGAGSGGYAKRHNPFIYYDDVAGDRARCSHLVGFAALSADLRAGELPRFAWITPNLCDDGHDCSVGAGDAFLARTVPALLAALGPHGFLVLTWDEGESNAGCCRGVAAGGQIATIVAGPDVIHGSRERAPLDHYGVLATIERVFGLPLLGGAGDGANGSLAPLFTHLPALG